MPAPEPNWATSRLRVRWDNLLKLDRTPRSNLVAGTSRHFQVEKLASGVYAAVATAGGFALCNAGIVDLGGETVVFDTMLTPMAGADLVRASERATGRRPAWVINSHWHGDHIWGNSAFAGSHVVSSRKVRSTVLELSRAQFESDRKQMRHELPLLEGPHSPYPVADREVVLGWFQGVLATPRAHRIVPPGVTFEDELILEGSRRSLRVVTYGGGHSPSDVFAYLPEEKVLFAGDLALNGLHPSVSNGRPSEWISILRRMEKLRATAVVPGHGATTGGQVLPRNRTYLQHLKRIVREALRDRVPVGRLAEMPIPAPYRRWGFSFMFGGNLARTYRLAQMRGTRSRIA